MSLAGRLRHTITIERATIGDTEDERGEKLRTWSVIATVRAWIQPKAVQEQADGTQGGSVTSDHVAFMLPTDIVEADIIRRGSLVYQVDGVRNAAGKDHHFEVACHLVTSGGVSA